MSVDGLFEWLVDGAPGAGSSDAVVTRIGEDLNRGGVDVERIGAFVSTLHPDVFGRGFTWVKGQKAQVREIGHAFLQGAVFQGSPVAKVYRERVEIRRRICDPTVPRDFAVVAELEAEGFTDYLALPMVFTTGDGHAITFATKRPGGFRDEDVASLRRVCRPLARLAEILALRRTAGNLLSTYVGRNAGDRVLAGQIKRGDIEDIHAVIWFSDLRGFTQLSQRASAREVIDALNQVFECQVAAVEKHGGEVLKFIGDGMLAIFSLDAEGPRSRAADGSPIVEEVVQRCDAALAAAFEAQAAFTALRKDLAFGLALHVGDVAYGNIGGRGRLDFTAIGPAVNLAARLEGLTGKLGRPIVLSAAFAAKTTHPTEVLGTFELKGVDSASSVFAPK